jgi:hypothetical protein
MYVYPYADHSLYIPQIAVYLTCDIHMYKAEAQLPSRFECIIPISNGASPILIILMPYPHHIWGHDVCTIAAVGGLRSTITTDLRCLNWTPQINVGMKIDVYIIHSYRWFPTNVPIQKLHNQE